MSAKKGRGKSKDFPQFPPPTSAPPTSPGSGLESSPRGFRKSELADLDAEIPAPSVTSVAPPAAGLAPSNSPPESKLKRTPSAKRHNNKHQDSNGKGGDGDAFTFPQRYPIQDLWQYCCDEVASEMYETNDFLAQMGIPPLTYKRDKTFPVSDYGDQAPDIETSKSKDFLDYYIFPVLLPAIQSLIDYAKANRVLQCRYCAFNPLDYIVEYLFNNNPRVPERRKNPTPLFEIGFVKSWLELYPRPPLPNWMIMTDDQAARILQRAVRGFLARIRPDVQEMRQFWKDYKKDMEEEKKQSGDMRSSAKLMSPYYDEIAGEWHEDDYKPVRLSAVFLTHSDTCEFCQRFKVFLQYQKEMMKNMIKHSYHDEEEEGEDAEETIPSSAEVKKPKIKKVINTVGASHKLKEAVSGRSAGKSKNALNVPGQSGRKTISKGSKKQKGSKN